MILPPDIIERIRFYCEANDLGFSVISTTDMSLVIMGSNQLSPDEISVFAAYTLLGGVVNGTWKEINHKLEKKEKDEKTN